MSRGPGRIEQQIEAAFVRDPDNAFTVEDLCDLIWPQAIIEKKHRVTVIRAGKRLAECLGWLAYIRGENRDRTLVFYSYASVKSCAIGWLKADRLTHYRDPDPSVWKSASEDDLRASLRPGGKHHNLVQEGYTPWREHEMWTVKQAGDTDRVKQIEADYKRRMRELGVEIPSPQPRPLKR
jgi:hypothetical protein